jgi:hypothetical protein
MYKICYQIGPGQAGVDDRQVRHPRPAGIVSRRILPARGSAAVCRAGGAADGGTIIKRRHVPGVRSVQAPLPLGFPPLQHQQGQFPTLPFSQQAQEPCNCLTWTPPVCQVNFGEQSSIAVLHPACSRSCGSWPQWNSPTGLYLKDEVLASVQMPGLTRRGSTCLAMPHLCNRCVTSVMR